jgi:hypothetical protein
VNVPPVSIPIRMLRGLGGAMTTIQHGPRRTGPRQMLPSEGRFVGNQCQP